MIVIIAWCVSVPAVLYVILDPFGRRKRRRWECVWRERMAATNRRERTDG